MDEVLCLQETVPRIFNGSGQGRIAKYFQKRGTFEALDSPHPVRSKYWG